MPGRAAPCRRDTPDITARPRDPRRRPVCVARSLSGAPHAPFLRRASSVAEKVARAVATRACVAEVQADASRVTAEAVEALVEAGVPLRDAGYLLGISHQRVAQILEERPTASSAARR